MAASASVASSSIRSSSQRSRMSSATRSVQSSSYKSSRSNIDDGFVGWGDTSQASSHRSTTSSKGESLQDGLQRMERKSSSSRASTSIKSHRSNATKSSLKSYHSTSSRSRASSKKSRGSQLDRIEEKSIPRRSSLSSVPSRSSSRRSVSSIASVSSRRSSGSASKSAKSVASQSARSVASQSHASTCISNLSYTAQQERGIDYLKKGNYKKAVIAFTKAIQSSQNEDGNVNNGGENDTYEQQSQLATLYGYRSEALYELGAYEASARDSRSTVEQLSKLKEAEGKGTTENKQWFGKIFNKSSTQDEQHTQQHELHHERGQVLHAKVLCNLGYCILRQGDDLTNGAFEEATSIATAVLDDVAKQVLGNDNEQQQFSNHYERATISLKESIKLATDGTSLLSKYQDLRTKIENATTNTKKEYLTLLDEAIQITPFAIELHIKKIKYFIGRRRWYAVVNSCEQVAAKKCQLDGIFKGGLTDLDTFLPGIPPLEELNAGFFNNERSTPRYLQTLSPKATRDAIFRLPVELLPYYLRSLRLEERYKGAMLACKALKEYLDTTQSKDNSTRNGYDFFEKEFDKLERTMKLKEEADTLYKDGNYNKALTFYGDCLSIDGGDSQPILTRPNSGLRNWPVPNAKVNSVGGKLHAVLHNNMAACFAAMGRNQDAITEATHAIHIHSMYTKAILRRARCFAIIEQRDKAQIDFNRYIMLVEGARECPYPPYNQGSACYFDMPSEVTDNQQLRNVKREMTNLRMQRVQRTRQSNETHVFATIVACLVESLCCKKSVVKSQVVTHPHSPGPVRRSQRPSQWPAHDPTELGSSSHEKSVAAVPSRKVSFLDRPTDIPDPPDGSLDEDDDTKPPDRTDPPSVDLD